MTTWTDDENGGTVWSDDETGGNAISNFVRTLLNSNDADDFLDAIDGVSTADLAAHTGDVANPHSVTSDQVPFTQSGSGLSATNVQDAIVEVDANLDAHIADTTAAHAASAIAFSPDGSIAATDVQAAVVEVDGDVTAHVTDSAGAHAASAISVTPAGSIAATDVQAALEEVAGRIGSGVLGTSQMHGANIGEMNCRLTLTSGTPVTTSDVTDAETLYLTPYKGNRIWLYDTTLTLWVPYALAEISIDVPDATGMYDVFVYDNSGTVTLEVVAWANTTTRATALTTQDGVYVKTGELNKRYVGSFYSTTDGNGQIADSAAKRHLWNMYNRVVRTLERKESTSSWNYTTGSWRQANDSASNQVSVARGLNEDAVVVDVMASVVNSTATERGAFVGIGLDSTSTPTGRWSQASVRGAIRQAQAGYSGLPGIGFHYFAWLEMGTGSEALTWYGVGGVLATQAGIGGWTLA